MDSKLHLLVLLTIFSPTFAHSQLKLGFSSTAIPSSRWLNTRPASAATDFIYSDGTLLRPVLVEGQPFFSTTSAELGFMFGFICTSECSSFLLAVVIVNIESFIAKNKDLYPGDVQVIWMANRSCPVKDGATLDLTSDGDLVLTNSDGRVAWSSSTSGKSVAGMVLNKNGSLVLFDDRKSTIWSSFNHPADTLLPGQRLGQGQQLRASVSASNWTRGQIYLIAEAGGLYAYIQSETPEQYYFRGVLHAEYLGGITDQVRYLKFIDQGAGIIFSPERNTRNLTSVELQAQFLRIDYDGHLRVYHYLGYLGWRVGADLFADTLDGCDYPTVCGSYGICLNEQCRCPKGEDSGSSYFRAVNGDPKLGCSATTPLTCGEPQQQRFVSLENISYFRRGLLIRSSVDTEACKFACLSNCSCNAVIFEYQSNASDGDCYLVHQVLSLKENWETYLLNSTVFLKVQLPIHSNESRFHSNAKKRLTIVVLVSCAIAALIILLVIIRIHYSFSRKKPAKEKSVDVEEAKENNFYQALGIPASFSYEELVSATKNFSKELGSGGSGTVFEGTLGDGKIVAVKRIERILQGKRQFLAEVEIIGSIHHVNLVRLIGFCIERSYYLLVYEYLSNGSLDKWIFQEDENFTLDWQTRHNIVLDVAKGLAYLHEDCQQRILHLDIKPQNILLDENFTAKISDFGLSKLIGKDQSKVITTMRGTVGYLAPEWLNSFITEKVDVYSFGILVLEIVCGRKNLDFCQPVEDIYLLKLLKEKAQENRLQDLVARDNMDMGLHLEQAVKMMMIAMWCLRSDYNSRPAMSKVVKVLEGDADFVPVIDYNSLIPSTMALVNNVSTPVFNFIPSGPR